MTLHRTLAGQTRSGNHQQHNTPMQTLCTLLESCVLLKTDCCYRGCRSCCGSVAGSNTLSGPARQAVPPLVAAPGCRRWIRQMIGSPTSGVWMFNVGRFASTSRDGKSLGSDIASVKLIYFYSCSYCHAAMPLIGSGARFTAGHVSQFSVIHRYDHSFVDGASNSVQGFVSTMSDASTGRRCCHSC